jgi:hypothetical protein
LYSFGGRDATGEEVAKAFRYNPTDDTWDDAAVADLPGAVRGASAVTVNYDTNYIYIMNGWDGNGPTNTLLRYDRLANAYSPQPPGLEATSYQTAVYYGSRLHRIGGIGSNSEALSSVEVYGERFLEPLPQGVSSAMAVVLNGSLYVAGGMTASGISTKTYKLIGVSWSDSAIADLPVGRKGAASGILDGKWVLAGGTEAGDNSAIAWDPATNTWNPITPMLHGRKDLAGGTIGTAFYAVGGDGDSGPTNDTQQYAVGACFTPTPTPTYSTITPFPSPTGISNCTASVVHAFSTCATPDSYSYWFELQSTCPLGHDLDFYLEAAPDVSGPWTRLAEQSRWVNPTYPFVVTGTFSVNIPEQYGWYRVLLAGQVLERTFNGQTDVMRICGRAPLCPPAWNMKAPYPIPVRDHAIAPLGEYLYSFGGSGDNVQQRYTQAYKYSQAADSWSALAPLPEALEDTSAVADAGRIYIMNGQNGTGPINTGYRYDPATDTYETIGPGLSATYGHAAAVLNGNLYRIGGYARRSPGSIVPTNTVEIYGVQYVAPLPLPLAQLTAVTLGGYIYVAGGSSGTSASAMKTYRYDPASDSWSDVAIADLPVGRYSTVSAILNGRWILAGGVSSEYSAISWDPGTNTWTPLTPLLHGRSYAAGGAIGQAFYVVGGRGYGATVNNQEYLPTGCASATPTVPTASPTSTITSTSIPTSVSTSIITSTATTIGTSTSTATAAATEATSTFTATPIQTTGTPTPCSISFTDVPQENTFYPFVRCLACRGIIVGYADGTFRPNNNVTRGQLAKIVSNSAGLVGTATQQTFEDVPIASTFHPYIERLAAQGVMGGYPCGGVGEPCIPPGDRPYFRPNANATRGQISKIVSNAKGYSDPAGGQIFEDVMPGSAFYDWVQRLASRGIMGGYPCGGPGEPCGAGSKPYFRPNNNATRGQTSKIIANTFFPGCETQLRP